MLGEQYLSRGSDSSKGVRLREAWPGKPLPDGQMRPGEEASLFWVAPEDSVPSVGRGHWWTDCTQVEQARWRG